MGTGAGTVAGAGVGGGFGGRPLFFGSALGAGSFFGRPFLFSAVPRSLRLVARLVWRALQALIVARRALLRAARQALLRAARRAR